MMNDYSARIELPEGKIKEIFKKINEAQETIYECYQELIDLGVVRIVEEKDASDN